MAGGTIAAIGVGLTAASTVGQFYNSKKQADYQARAMNDQRRADVVRRRAMEFDAMRRRREIIRQGQIARSMALAAAVNQGAEQGTGLMGGYGQIAGRVNTNLQGVQGNLELGREMFDINADMSNNFMMAAKYGTQASMWRGVGQLGGQLVRGQAVFDRLGDYWSGRGTGPDWYRQSSTIPRGPNPGGSRTRSGYVVPQDWTEIYSDY